MISSFSDSKRLQRALLSDDYKQKQQNPKNGLIPVANNEDVQKFLFC